MKYQHVFGYVDDVLCFGYVDDVLCFRYVDDVLCFRHVDHIVIYVFGYVDDVLCFADDILRCKRMHRQGGRSIHSGRRLIGKDAVEKKTDLILSWTLQFFLILFSGCL